MEPGELLELKVLHFRRLITICSRVVCILQLKISHNPNNSTQIYQWIKVDWNFLGETHKKTHKYINESNLIETSWKIKKYHRASLPNCLQTLKDLLSGKARSSV